ncbi:MAG: helix-turn-helix domain-containing protein [Desulfococcaceae bacterium]
MSSKKELNVQEIIDRVKKCLSIKTDVELATALNINQSAISAWKRRGNINLNSIITICPNISLDWLIYGEGTPDGKPESEPEEDIIKKTIIMMRELDTEGQRDVFKYIQKEKLLREIKEQFSEMRKAG